MKRLTILIIILTTCFSVFCLGQSRARALIQKVIQLTEPNTQGTIPFEAALAKQRNVLAFTGQTLERSVIGQLAWAALGIRESQKGLQTPLPQDETSDITLYLATDEGVFVYQPQENSLEQKIYQDVRIPLAAATAPMGDSVAGAGCTFIITAPTRRLAQRSTNTRISTYLQAGQIAQNIRLQAICLNLGASAISNFNSRSVTTACRLPRNLVPIYIISVGYPASPTISEAGNNQENAAPKRAALIVPSVNFQDEELFETLRALNAAAVQTVIASTRTGILKGSRGTPIEAGILVNQLKVDDYDALIFIGGIGAGEYIFDQAALSLIRQAWDKRKILAATSTAPTILASAGILKGVKVTALITESDRLKAVGAVYTGTPVEQNMKIITCTSPAAAVPFARAVTDAITGK